jgi:hypothetical protein
MSIGEMFLASLVYHAGWMKEFFSETHCIFTTPLLSQGISKKLKDVVHCHIANGNNPLAITGIPPHVLILIKMHRIRDDVRNLVPRIEKVVPDIVQGVTDVLEERAIGAGTVTTHDLKEMIKNVMGDVLGEAGVPEMLEFARTHDQACNIQPAEHNLCGRPILAPEFVFPNQPPLTLWQLWCCGNMSLNHSSFCLLISPIETQENDFQMSNG